MFVSEQQGAHLKIAIEIEQIKRRSWHHYKIDLTLSAARGIKKIASPKFTTAEEEQKSYGRSNR